MILIQYVMSGRFFPHRLANHNHNEALSVGRILSSRKGVGGGCVKRYLLESGHPSRAVLGCNYIQPSKNVPCTDHSSPGAMTRGCTIITWRTAYAYIIGASLAKSISEVQVSQVGNCSDIANKMRQAIIPVRTVGFIDLHCGLLWIRSYRRGISGGGAENPSSNLVCVSPTLSKG